jgi:negative regulator of flagellin synthesis FlgM
MPIIAVGRNISMKIEGVGSIDPIQPGKKPSQNSRVAPSARSDSISLSSEAIEKAELYLAKELVSAVSDVREERIAELRQKINDPSYINEKIIGDTADKILEAFGL